MPVNTETLQQTWAEGPGVTVGGACPSAPRAELLAGRYQLGREIGRGGNGVVVEGIDQLTGERVAVKRVRAGSPAELRLARREVASLRWLDLPGVAHLLDDGIEAGEWYLVMDFVEGSAFPDGDRVWRWDELEGPAVQLLDVLERVHEAGIFHGDLKPGNVRLRPDGRIVVLDFGIAAGRALPSRGPDPLAGTLHYMSPERLRGAPLDARVDLYAIGQMLHDALTGDGREKLEVRPGLPVEVVELVRALFARRPEDRPESAEAALARLGHPPVRLTDGLCPGRPWDEAALRALFAGPDAFLHLREDAARVLWQRAGRTPAAVEAELQRWVRAGLARPEGGKVVIDRLAIELLEDRPQERRLRALLRARASGEETVTEVLAVAGRWMRNGQPRRGLSTLLLGLDVARREQLVEVEEALLLSIAAAAMSEQRRPPIRRARVEIARSGLSSAALDGADRILHALDADLCGTVALVPALVGGLPTHPNEELEIWRAGLLVRAGRLPASEEHRLIGLEGWASTPRRRARWLAWQGNFKYLQGDYPSAAAMHLESSALRETRHEYIVSTLNAAEAHIDAAALDEAASLAQAARFEAARGRLPREEVRATTLVRSARLRARKPQVAAPELAEAALQVDLFEGAKLALVEAVVAWDAGDPAGVRGLALRAAEAFERVGRLLPGLLGRGLACAAGASVEGLLQAVTRAPLEQAPAIGVQIYGLLALGGHALTVAEHDRAARLAASWPLERWDERREVLSVRESLAALSVASGSD
jgi:hypothetical protein